MSLKCCICQKGPDVVGVLFRINAKGMPGIWACGKHRNQTDGPRDQIVDEIVSTLNLKATP